MLLPLYHGRSLIESSTHFRLSNRREAFVALDDKERLDILSEPLDEIVRMLEQNLLNKFNARTKLEIGELSCGAWRNNKYACASNGGLLLRCEGSFGQLLGAAAQCA